MVRGELLRALGRDAVPVAARRSLRRLLEEQALSSYLRLAESGALRTRLVAGARPPTSKTTNEVRRQCLDVLREAIGLPIQQLGGGAPQLRPTPPSRTWRRCGAASIRTSRTPCHQAKPG